MPSYSFEAKNVRDGSTDVKAGQALTMEWDAVTDTATLDAGDVIAALASVVGIAKGSAHPTYAYARCTRISAKVFEADPFRWAVKADFIEPAPQPGDPVDPAGGQPEPPDRDPWVSGSFRLEEVFRDHDENSVSIVNSAGDAFDNPPAQQFAIGVITVTRYYDSISFTALMAYVNKRNSDAWQGFPIDSLRITGVSWSPHSDRGWTGWKVVFNVEFRPVQPEQLEVDPTATGGWNPTPVLDIGWYEYVDTDIIGLLKRPYEEPNNSGIPRTTPGFLNGVDGVRSDVPTFLAFSLYDDISFAILG